MTVKKHMKNSRLVTKAIPNKGFSGKLRISTSNENNYI